MPTLSAAQRGKIRRLSQPKELSPDEEGGELNIVPFLDIIVNILIFVLASVAVTFTSTIETTPPPAGGGAGVRAAVPEQSLRLSVIIVNDGFAVKASGGNVAPGCSGPGSGLAIPKRGPLYDYAALRECAERLKKASPAFAEEDQVFLSANPGVPYQDLINTMDALRSTRDGSPLFENVNFQVKR